MFLPLLLWLPFCGLQWEEKRKEKIFRTAARWSPLLLMLAVTRP